MKVQNPNNHTLTDKAFSRFLITSVLGILICITCLCSATWAWFSADTSSGSNTLSSGKFDLDISLTDPNGAPVPLFEQESGVFTCTLEGAVAYTVTRTSPVCGELKATTTIPTKSPLVPPRMTDTKPSTPTLHSMARS